MISSVITTKLPENTPWGPSRNPYILESSREHCMLRKRWKNTFKKIRKCLSLKKGPHIKTSCLSKQQTCQFRADTGCAWCACAHMLRCSLFHALMPSKMPAMTLWPPGAWLEHHSLALSEQIDDKLNKLTLALQLHWRICLEHNYHNVVPARQTGPHQPSRDPAGWTSTTHRMFCEAKPFAFIEPTSIYQPFRKVHLQLQIPQVGCPQMGNV